MVGIGSRTGEAALGAGSICTVIAGLSWLNNDVRRYVANLLVGDPHGELASVTAQAHTLTRYLYGTLGDYQTAHGPLVVFALASAVLLFFMLQARVG